MTFKEMRQKMGLTQKQISDIYGIPYSTIQKWEAGINKPAEYVINMMWEIFWMRIYKEMVES